MVEVEVKTSYYAEAGYSPPFHFVFCISYSEVVSYLNNRTLYEAVGAATA